jgi:MarR family transcriptional regulator, temperature-dependent positive regulator of motility
MPDRSSLLVLSLLHLLHCVSQRADRQFAREIASENPTPRQWAILEAVAAKNGLSQSAIRVATGIDRSTVTVPFVA